MRRQIPGIDGCVSAWLWDIRQVTEMESTSILLAKSVLLAVKRSQKSSEDLTTSESVDNPLYWDQLSHVVTVSNSSDGRLSVPCLTVQTDGDGRRPDSLELKDSLLASSDPSFRSPKKLVEDSSMDSACGSSPVFSNDSPLQTSSPIPGDNDRSNSGSSTSPTLITASVCHYETLKDSIGKMLFHISLIYTASNSLRPSKKVLKSLRAIPAELEHSSPVLISSEDLHSLVELINYQLNLMDTPALDIGEDKLLAALEVSVRDPMRQILNNVVCSIAQVLLGFLQKAATNDPLLEVAVGQIAHCGLFGDHICFEMIQAGGVTSLVRLCKDNLIPLDTLKVTLRALAVLCSVSKGCVQLLALGGLDTVVRLLCTTPRCCAVEAAGVLTQLTAPCHSFAALPPSLPRIISRLLDLCDECRDADGFLLCSAAIANLSQQHNLVSDILYRQNAVMRIAQLYHTKTCQTVFVQDQIATIFSQLSSQGYHRALIAQGGIACLLSLIRVANDRYPDLTRRIKYKAAICLGKIASTGDGMKSLKDNNATQLLTNSLQNDTESPAYQICKSFLSWSASNFNFCSGMGTCEEVVLRFDQTSADPIGIHLTDTPQAEVYVVSLEENSSSASLFRMFDMIMMVNGIQIKDRLQAENLLNSFPKLEVVVRRLKSKSVRDPCGCNMTKETVNLVVSKPSRRQIAGIRIKAKHRGHPGVYVTGLKPGSGAESVLQLFDVITHINDIPVSNMKFAQQLVQAARHEFRVTVRRWTTRCPHN